MDKEFTFHVPDDAASVFQEAFGQDLDRAALEALVIEGYRARKFGISQVRRLLGLETRWDAEKWLGERCVNWNYNAEDLEEDRRTLREMFGGNG